MIYVLSDLHGCYDQFLKMLELIRFTAEDTLCILGDICDRGEHSAKLYLDIMDRSNVKVLKGNHEMMAEEHLADLIRQRREYGVSLSEMYMQDHLWHWFENGGVTTLKSVFKELDEDQDRICAYIQSLPYYFVEEVNGKRYVMVHGGLMNPGEEVNLDEVGHRELVWSRPYFDGTYFEDENTYLVVGHTPTFTLRQPWQNATIYHGKGNVIGVDCGVIFPDYLGRLGCLCLDTGEEFYV